MVMEEGMLMLGEEVVEQVEEFVYLWVLLNKLADPARNANQCKEVTLNEQRVISASPHGKFTKRTTQ